MSGDAAAEAAGMVAAVRDDQDRRLELAASFYDDGPGRPPIRAYRRAEMAFMNWQVRRGLLAAPDVARPGSGWWRSVNSTGSLSPRSWCWRTTRAPDHIRNP